MAQPLMRILSITPSFHPAVGGVETHVRRVSECLADAGHQVTVLTHADVSSEETLGRVHVCRLPRTGWLRSWWAARPYIASADIVHCHDAYSFLHFYLPSSWLPPRRPVFATFHGYEQYPIPEEAVRRRGFVRRRVINALCMGEFICRWYDTSCFGVSYGGTDPLLESPPLPDEASAVFIGRLAEDTSLMLYLDALAILRHEYGRTLKLGVAGEGPLRPLAEKFVEAQGLRVRFLGAVADPGPLLDAASSAFVSGYLAIWQALARRRLVFAVHENELKHDYVTCFPEARTVLAISDSAADLAAVLNHHLDHPGAGDEMRRRGTRLAAENTWEKVAQLYLAMYRAHGFM